MAALQQREFSVSGFRQMRETDGSTTDDDWVETNDVAGARASGTAFIRPINSEGLVHLAIVASAGNTPVAGPFAGSVDVELLQVVGSTAGDRLIKTATATIDNLLGVALTVPIGAGEYAIRVAAYTTIDGTVTKLAILAKIT